MSVRTTVSLAVLALLGFVLYVRWPAEALDALRNDPNAVLRWPWQPAQPDEDPVQVSPRSAPVDPPAPGARPFFFRMEAPGGARVVEHLSTGRVERALAARQFDYVVLQEQQQCRRSTARNASASSRRRRTPWT